MRVIILIGVAAAAIFTGIVVLSDHGSPRTAVGPAPTLRGVSAAELRSMRVHLAAPETGVDVISPEKAASAAVFGGDVIDVEFATCLLPGSESPRPVPCYA